MSETTTVEGTEAPPTAEPPATEAPAAVEAPAASAWSGPPADAPPVMTPPSDAAPPAPPEQPPDPVPAAPAAKPSRRSVHVPMWLLGLLAMGVLVVGAFFVGRETAPDASSSGPTTLAEAVEATAAGEMPVGDFNLQDLVAALQQNGNLNLGDILDLLGGNR